MGRESERLTELFAKLGARAPAAWAASQLEEGIPQLARFLFLRQAWRRVVSESDQSWQDQSVRDWQARPDAPYAGIGRSLHSLRGKGATPEEITDLVRGMQARLLFALCYQLDDPGDLEPEVRETTWGLFLLDGDEKPVERIGGLHESVLETDPTGREMRPPRLPG